MAFGSRDGVRRGDDADASLGSLTRLSDAECVALLQWALPRLHLRWRGYRNVRGQVRKRIKRRMAELHLTSASDYRTRLEVDSAEWMTFERLCRVTISRFYRDRAVWNTLENDVLPVIAQAASAAGGERLTCWSVGCASGEEPYTLSILWTLRLAHRYPRLDLHILAADVDERLLARARIAEYSAGTLRDLPRDWRSEAFAEKDGAFVLHERFRAPVDLCCQDVRRTMPDDRFHLILCRNLVCTYFDETLQQQTLSRVAKRLLPGGALVMGRHEQLPDGTSLHPWYPDQGIYRTSVDPA